MKKNILCITLISSIMLAISSCKKAEVVSPTISASEESTATTQASDGNSVSANIDGAINDVNTLLAGGTPTGRVDMTYASPTIVAISTTSKTLNYNSSIAFADGGYRSGSIKVELSSKNKYFYEKGAVYTVTYYGYAVREKSGVSTTLTGTHIVTNVSGGLPTKFWLNNTTFTGGSIIHKVRGNMSINFDGSETSRDWIVARKITWSKDSTVGINYFVEGDTTISTANLSFSNVEIAGTNRAGNSFYTQLTTPLVVNKTKCSSKFPYISGSKLHTLVTAKGNITATTTFLNTDNDACSDGYSLSITNSLGLTKTKTVNW
jgi:hypothetical protein